jgi:hypothetical protein
MPHCQRCLEVDQDIQEMVEELKLAKGLLRSIRIAKTVQMDQLSQQIKQISEVVDSYGTRRCEALNQRKGAE